MVTTFAERLVAYRKKRNMTQLELADKLSTRQSTVSRWERGVTEPVGLYATKVNKMLDRDTVRG